MTTVVPPATVVQTGAVGMCGALFVGLLEDTFILRTLRLCIVGAVKVEVVEVKHGAKPALFDGVVVPGWEYAASSETTDSITSTVQ